MVSRDNYYYIRVDDSGRKQICTWGKDKAEGGDGEGQDFCITDKESFPEWLRKIMK